MNNKEKQRNRELQYVLNFLKQKILFIDEIIQLKNDPPDFVLSKKGKYIGLEIVELWPIENSRPIVSAYEKVIQIAEYQFNNLSNIKLKLSFTFSGVLDISNNQHQILGSKISNWVYHELVSQIVTLQQNEVFLNPILDIPQLIKIKYHIPNGSNLSNWHLSMEFNFCIPISDNEIVTQITNKFNQTKRWNREFDFFEKWLLIVITEDPHSTFLNNQQRKNNWNTKGLFDEVFFYDDFMRQLIN